MEEYRTVEGYEGLYEVTNTNKIKSLDRYVNNNGTLELRKGRFLKLHTNKYRYNYVSVMLCKDGKPKRIKFHHIVAKAFPEICGEWFDGCQVDHIDGNTQNNIPTNLRIVTPKENMNNPITRKRCSNAWTIERREERSRIMKENNPMKNKNYVS